MSDSLITKQQLSTFGRNVSLLFNRSMMYQPGHPLVVQSVEELHKSAIKLLDEISPLVFILNREEFYVDEDPIDPRINVARIVALFKKTGMQSISFEGDIEPREIKAFIETVSNPARFPDAEAIKNELNARGAHNIKVNHVLYKKVTEDDKVISKEIFRKVTPSGADKEELKTRKMFMDSLLASVVSEELSKTLNIESLITNPAALSQKMIEADLDFVAKQQADFSESGADAPISDQSGAIDGSGADGQATGVQGAPGGQAAGGSGGGPSAAYGQPGAAGDHAGAPGSPSAKGIPGGAPAGVEGGAGDQGMPGMAGAPETQPGRSIEAVSDEAISGDGTFGEGTSEEATSGEGTFGDGGSGTRTAAYAQPGAAGDPAAKAPGGIPATPVEAGMTGAIDAAAGAPGEPASSETAGKSGALKKKGVKHPNGPVILQQLDMIDLEVEKGLAGESDVSLSDLASAIFDMKKQLLNGIEAQKALGTAYENEEIIAEKANALTDKVLVGLIKEEYKAGEISTQRMAQILRRLVPEANELKRLLPKIKKALMEEGMSAVEYLELIRELGKELESEGLSRVLEESAEEIGLDSEGIIEEVKQNPEQAAQLIYLASELKKETGNEEALTEILAEYVEELGSKMAIDTAKKEGVDDKDHLAEVMSGVETGILRQLSDLNVENDVIVGLEKRLNDRMEDILDGMRDEWLQAQEKIGPKEKVKKLTILETLEQSVSEQEELGQFLKQVREKADEDELDENDFRQIHGELLKIQHEQRLKEAKKKLPPGVLKTNSMTFILEKEIAKANRYGYLFSVLAFSLVKARPVNPTEKLTLSDEDIIDEVLLRFYDTFREVDVVGQLGKNKIVAVLPLVGTTDARKALSRVMKLIHAEDFEVNDILIDLKVAGIASTHRGETPTDIEKFTNNLTDQLTDMATRIRNINAYI